MTIMQDHRASALRHTSASSVSGLAEDEKNIVQDGERITVPLQFMDAIQRAVARYSLYHDDGPPDEEIEAARREWMQRTADAWRQNRNTLPEEPRSDLPYSLPKTKNQLPNSHTPSTEDRLEVEQARAERNARIANAWRNP